VRATFLSASVLLTLALAGVSTARAQFVVPTSYSFSVAPNNHGGFSYPDTGGGELIDNTPGSLASFTFSTAPDGPFVGWYTVTPTITFQFSSAQTFSRIEIGTVQYPGASIGLPSTITVSGTPFNFTSGALTEDTRGSLILNGTFATDGTNTLTITFGSPVSSLEWLFLDEVRFTAIPEPAQTAALLSLATVSVLIVRRRKSRPSSLAA
jgi:hypothetical protein